MRKPNKSDLKDNCEPSNLLNFTALNGGNAISKSIFACESKGIGILEVGIRRRKWEKENGARELGEENKSKKRKKVMCWLICGEKSEKK